jgi:hypothetical protein
VIFDIDKVQIKPAKTAHELFMVNLGALLLLGPAAVFLGIGRLGIVLPIIISLLFILFTYLKTRRLEREGPWFVLVHWRQALRNYRWLGIGFSLTLLFLLISWGLEQSLDAHSPSHFLAVALTRIGVMPTIIMIFACFVIENGALNQVLRHEVPDKLVAAYPPPADLLQKAPMEG